MIGGAQTDQEDTVCFIVFSVPNNYSNRQTLSFAAKLAILINLLKLTRSFHLICQSLLFRQHCMMIENFLTILSVSVHVGVKLGEIRAKILFPCK